MYLHGLASFGAKVVKIADAVSTGAQRVSGAVKGAAVGSKEPEIRTSTPWIIAGIAGAAALVLLVKGKR